MLLLCTNTMHKVADAITSTVDTPLLHIVDATAEAIRSTGLSTIGLLGTAYTMEQDFYVGRLRAHHALNVLVPEAEDRLRIHEIIYDELCLGIIEDGSRRAFASTISELVDRGAEGIVLGCTEIGLLVGPDDTAVPVFDTTRLHARRAVELALDVEQASTGSGV
jgi:aspartate racemase